MASNPKDPMSRFFERDQQKSHFSNFNLSYKNRISADFGYLYPVGLWDVPSNADFKLNLKSVVSSNPTLSPILGKVIYRVEAYFVEKAAYCNRLRNNDKFPLDRNVSLPTFSRRSSAREFSPRSSLLEFLQMYPRGWTSKFINGSQPEQDATPPLNAIPFIMYYDIYRNYYANPQDDNIPLRLDSFVPGIKHQDGEWDPEPIPINDIYIHREQLDDFVANARDSDSVDDVFNDYVGITPFGIFPNSPLGDSRAEARSVHRGLLRRTLNNDFFTSFISNENVELMKSRANVSVHNGVVNVEQIQLANRNWRLATRSMLWGTDWKDYNKIHYGANILIPYGKPQFLGSLSTEITFNDVISQAQTGSQGGSPTDNTNLGSRAGLAFGGLKNHDGYFVNFRTKDEGYVMVLASLVPEVDYYQGIDPMFFKTNLQHSWIPEYNSVGMQDFHRSWACIVPESQAVSTTIGFDTWNVAEHKVPIWFEYMAKYNQLHGDFTDENYLRYWVFARPFSNLNALFSPGMFKPVDEQIESDVYFSTYCLPEMFNYVFANNIGFDNFQLQFNFDCKCSFGLDKQVLSYL